MKYLDFALSQQVTCNGDFQKALAAADSMRTMELASSSVELEVAPSTSKSTTLSLPLSTSSESTDANARQDFAKYSGDAEAGAAGEEIVVDLHLRAEGILASCGGDTDSFIRSTIFDKEKPAGVVEAEADRTEIDDDTLDPIYHTPLRPVTDGLDKAMRICYFHLPPVKVMRYLLLLNTRYLRPAMCDFQAAA